jgi:hypothetical protein
VDVKTGETLEELYSNDKCNVGAVTLEKDTKELRAVSYNYARMVSLLFPFHHLVTLHRQPHSLYRWYPGAQIL